MAIGKSKKDAKKGKSAKKSSAALNAEAMAEDDKPVVDNWADKKDSDVYEKAAALYEKIVKCYDNKQEQNERIEEYWNIHAGRPDDNVSYGGNSQCYIPVVRDAIEARVKRSLAQLFPANNKRIEAIGPTGESPKGVMALLEHYIRKTNLKNVVRADLIAGDVTGQWNLMIDWTKSTRSVTKLVKKPPIMANDDIGLEVEDKGADPVEKKETTELVTELPDVVPFATEDLAVYPATASSIQAATAVGVRLRMSKDKVQEMIDDGIFVGLDAKDIIEQLGPDGAREKTDPNKKRTEDAGIKTSGAYKYALIFAVYTDLKLEGKSKEPVIIYFGGEDCILGIVRNPFWSGKRPILSAPIEEVTGSFFGISKVEPVKFLQWNLNDFWNMGMDSAQYALLPITMTDPLKNPNYQSMVMGLAAVWLVDPNSTKFEQFPPLWKDATQLCQGIKTQIYESMDVNDAMMGKMPPGRKNAQMVGNMQQEQQINITDHAKRYEEMILQPLVEWFFELDQQFRTEDITVQTMGEVGARAALQTIEPQQFDKTWFFQWIGTAFQTGMQRMQQMIATMNVIRGIPPQQLNGHRLDITPILESLVEQVYGPELGPRILIDERNQFTIPPEVENDMLHMDMPIEIHPGDDHMKHIQKHNEAAKTTGDLTGSYRTHIMAHVKVLQEQAQKAAGAQQQQGGAPGVPGGGQPGVAGTPRPGAQPGQPRMQQPAGAIPADQGGGPPRG